MRYMLFILGFSLLSAPAMAQGYEGLIAPDSNSPAPQQAAPQKSTVRPAPAKVTPARRAPANLTRKAAPAPRSAPPVLTDAPKRVWSSNMTDEEIASEMMQNPSSLIALMKDKEFVEKALENTPQQPMMPEIESLEINGMSLQETSVKDTIEDYMKIINNQKIPPEKRKKAAEIAYRDLLGMAEPMRMKAMIPDAVYTKAGLPEKAVREQQAANANSLKRIDDAFKILIPMLQ
jgi:hypothetical protein